MKEVTIPKTVILSPAMAAGFSMQAAFDMIFGEKTLRRVHGDEIRVDEWFNDKRKLKFNVPVKVPAAIRPFFCGETVKVTATQTRVFENDNKTVTVSNKLRLHFVGSELFVVRPVFVMTRDNTGVSISGRVETHAVLPPGICNIAETYMAKKAEEELRQFERAIHERVIADNVFTSFMMRIDPLQLL